MFRIKIAWTIVILLLFVLGMAAGMYWGAQRAEYYLERSHLAHNSHEAYIRVSLDVYQHYKELVDVILIGTENNSANEQTEQSFQGMLASLQNLKRATSDELSHVLGEAEEQEEEDEAAQVEELEHIVFESLRAFDRVNLLYRQGNQIAATEILKSVLEDTIDKGFKPKIDAAISGEAEEVEQARQRVNHLTQNLKTMSALIAVSASLFALFVAVLLWRNLRAPIDALVWGTRRVADGDLEHRININGRNEFTYLARKFNNMTDDLAKQRNELLDAKAHLEDKVEERTHELYEANCKLQRIDQARRQFFADVSHELRTPLTIIRGEAEVTLRGRDKEVAEYRGSLQRIVDHSSQMAKLIDDLLFIVRSESESIRFDLNPLALNEMVLETGEDAKALKQQMALEVIASVPEQPICVRGDASRLKQVLLILIDNACRYSQEGGQIHISLSVDHSYAVIAVSDTGVGIAEEDLGSIFERFYRGDAARKLVPSGTGLGLPLAKTIIAAHQGRIMVSSKLAVGTTVSLAIPLYKENRQV